MKPSRAFWGTLFVVFGTLFLLAQFFDLTIGWDFVWKFWPVVFVFIGLVLVFRDARIKVALASAAALGLALFLYGIFSFSWVDTLHADEWDVAENDVHVQEFSEPMTEDVTHARLEVDAAAGSYRLDASTDRLFAAKVRTTIGRYTLDRDPDEQNIRLRFRPEGHVRVKSWRPGRAINEAELKLHTRPLWDLQIDAGAAKLDFDLSPFNVEHLRLEAGAASVKLRLGMPAEETTCRIESGASTVRIEVPSDAGCEIRYDGGLSSRRFRGFDRITEGRYRTENFHSATKKIYIDADAGVSTISVVRY